MEKWIEWKKREIYPEFVVQINCCPIERNDEHRNGVHRAIIEIRKGLSADGSNPPLSLFYHLYIGRVPKIYHDDKNFNDKIHSFIIANEKRIIQNWEIIPITVLSEEEQNYARRACKLWGNNPNSAQYQINQYISQLEEQEREEFQTQAIAEEQSPLSSPIPADPAQPKKIDNNQNSPQTVKVVHPRPKGGRRTKEEEKILYAYIYLSFCYMVKHPNKKGAIETPPSFANAVKGRIKRGGGNLVVNSRTFDKGKNPGRFYRYLIAKKYSVYLYGYTELDYINDKDFADKCITEATDYINSLDDKRKKKLLEGFTINGNLNSQ
ncbi:MAG: hypothetical protein IJG38_12970 [Thermoguttaceae bacterium]|nr:hypothetical protein [Thermoguttaceae bacterium]MBQ6617494.1 hypothetical protein [Thermoguttaceae bacterium]